MTALSKAKTQLELGLRDTLNTCMKKLDACRERQEFCEKNFEETKKTLDAVDSAFKMSEIRLKEAIAQRDAATREFEVRGNEYDRELALAKKYEKIAIRERNLQFQRRKKCEERVADARNEKFRDMRDLRQTQEQLLAEKDKTIKALHERERAKSVERKQRLVVARREREHLLAKKDAAIAVLRSNVGTFTTRISEMQGVIDTMSQKEVGIRATLKQSQDAYGLLTLENQRYRNQVQQLLDDLRTIETREQDALTTMHNDLQIQKSQNAALRTKLRECTTREQMAGARCDEKITRLRREHVLAERAQRRQLLFQLRPPTFPAQIAAANLRTARAEDLVHALQTIVVALTKQIRFVKV